MTAAEESARMNAEKMASMAGASTALIPSTILALMTAIVSVLIAGGEYVIFAAFAIACIPILLMCVYNWFECMRSRYRRDYLELLACSVIEAHEGDIGPDYESSGGIAELADDLRRYFALSDQRIDDLICSALSRVSAEGPSTSGVFFLDTPYPASQSS